MNYVYTFDQVPIAFDRRPRQPVYSRFVLFCSVSFGFLSDEARFPLATLSVRRDGDYWAGRRTNDVRGHSWKKDAFQDSTHVITLP